jgi:hypothetical protein
MYIVELSRVSWLSKSVLVGRRGLVLLGSIVAVYG